jgi:hypothetical protein
MSPLFVFYIMIILMIVLVVILFTTGQFKPYVTPGVATSSFISAYSIPSPWTTAIPIQGIEGQCGVYTFTGQCNPSNPCNVAPQIKLADVSNNLINKIATGPNLNVACTDSDQVFIQKVQHTCLFGKVGVTGPQAIGCVKQDGSIAAENEIEEFWQMCQPGSGNGTSAGQTQTATANQNVCPGVISGVGFGYTGSGQPTVPYCLVAPTFNVTNQGNPQYNPPYPSVAPCDLGSHDTNGNPNQLFRVVRATYTQGAFKQNNSGYFMKVVHRPTGYCLAPPFEQGSGVLNFNKPTTGNLQLIPCGSYNDGYWWMIAPSIAPTANNPISIKPNIPPNSAGTAGWNFNPQAYPQMVYVSNPSILSPDLNTDTIWTLLTNNISPVYSVCLDSVSNPTSITSRPYLIYDAGVPGNYNANPNSTTTQTSNPGSIVDYTCTPKGTATCNAEGITRSTTLDNDYTHGYNHLAPQTVAQGCAFQYYDYTIYNLIANQPKTFGF